MRIKTKVTFTFFLTVLYSKTKTQDSYLTALLSYCTKTCTFLLLFWGGELETNAITQYQYYIAAELPTTTSTHKFACQCFVQAKFAF